MKKSTLTLTSLSLLIFSIFLLRIFIGYYGEFSSFSSKEFRTKGNPETATFKVVEFIDFQCPSCAKGAALLESYRKKHPKQISVEVKYFPLKIHAHAWKAALYAECAGRQGKFWQFHDAILNQQDKWKHLPDAEPFFRATIRSLRLNNEKVEACLLNDHSTLNTTIMNDITEGRVHQIKSTPTYFINDERVVGFKALIKKLTETFGELSE